MSQSFGQKNLKSKFEALIETPATSEIWNFLSATRARHKPVEPISQPSPFLMTGLPIPAPTVQIALPEPSAASDAYSVADFMASIRR